MDRNTGTHENKQQKDNNNGEKTHRDLLFTLFTRTVRVALQELFPAQ